MGRSPGEGNGYPLQYSGLENPMDCIIHGVARAGHNRVTFTSLHTLLAKVSFHSIPKESDSHSSRVQLFSMLWTVACQTTLSIKLSRKDTRVHCHFLLQGIFPTQRLNPGLLHCRQSLYHLSHQGSPTPKKPNPKAKECSNYHTIELISHIITR